MSKPKKPWKDLSQAQQRKYYYMAAAHSSPLPIDELAKKLYEAKGKR